MTVSKMRQVLEAMAQSPSQAVRRRFFQLRVMDYVTRELSLEMELASADPLKGRGSAASAAQSGRSSGLPTPSSLQVPPRCWQLLLLDMSGCAHGPAYVLDTRAAVVSGVARAVIPCLPRNL